MLNFAAFIYVVKNLFTFAIIVGVIAFTLIEAGVFRSRKEDDDADA